MVPMKEKRNPPSDTVELDVSAAAGAMDHEGMPLSEEEKDVLRDFASGKISEDEAIRRALALRK
jgi:hypothetical protein